MDKPTALDGEGSRQWSKPAWPDALAVELIEPGTPWDLGHVGSAERKVDSGARASPL
jgi:hypothetical protein